MLLTETEWRIYSSVSYAITDQHQAIIWTNAGKFWLDPWGQNSVIIELKYSNHQTEKTVYMMSSPKYRPIRLGWNEYMIFGTAMTSKLSQHNHSQWPIASEHQSALMYHSSCYLCRRVACSNACRNIFWLSNLSKMRHTAHHWLAQ